MDTIGKCNAIVEFATDTVVINSGLHDDFFSYNDLGIPLAIAVNAKLAELNEEGSKIIEETFNLLCEEMGIPVKDYQDYDEMIDLAAEQDDEKNS